MSDAGIAVDDPERPAAANSIRMATTLIVTMPPLCESNALQMRTFCIPENAKSMISAGAFIYSLVYKSCGIRYHFIRERPGKPAKEG